MTLFRGNGAYHYDQPEEKHKSRKKPRGLSCGSGQLANHYPSFLSDAPQELAILKYVSSRMQKLPVGIQSFQVLRSEGHLYVDKTALLHRLVTEGKYYFLSRPRRFGKSLMVSTLIALFEGKRALFDRLWIDDQWDWTQTNPVII